MMSDATARLVLPMIFAGQAQKEMTHNAALAILDAAVQPSVQGFGVDTPPIEPAVGACWIVGATPNGAWGAHPGELAQWTAAGWQFLKPTPGFQIWVESLRSSARFVDGVWTTGRLEGEQLWLHGTKMLSIPATSISGPVGGTTVDDQCRTAVSAILEVLRHHNLTA